jgi:hypothetical protein
VAEIGVFRIEALPAGGTPRGARDFITLLGGVAADGARTATSDTGRRLPWLHHADLVINLTTAQALGLTIPESFLLRADEVIE